MGADGRRGARSGDALVPQPIAPTGSGGHWIGRESPLFALKRIGTEHRSRSEVSGRVIIEGADWGTDLGEPTRCTAISTAGATDMAFGRRLRRRPTIHR